MSFEIISFDSGKLPAAITSVFGVGESNDLVGNGGGLGFPSISIKGKVFHIVRGKDKTLVTKPGEDDPASAIEVVLVKVNPNNSKTFYANGYIEGADSKPTCYSNSGDAPEADAQEPQAKKCAICAHNQWGSRVTQDGKKGKACSDVRRLAVATVDTPADPMLVRVPAASLKAMIEYGKILAARGVPPEAVVTRIGFDYSVAHPALTFKPVGIIGDPDQLRKIKEVGQSELAARIAGMKTVLNEEPEEVEVPAAVPETAPAVVKAATAAPKVAAAPKAAVTPPTPVAAKGANLEAQISGMLDEMGFDDTPPVND